MELIEGEHFTRHPDDTRLVFTHDPEITQELVKRDDVAGVIWKRGLANRYTEIFNGLNEVQSRAIEAIRFENDKQSKRFRLVFSDDSEPDIRGTIGISSLKSIFQSALPREWFEDIIKLSKVAKDLPNNKPDNMNMLFLEESQDLGRDKDTIADNWHIHGGVTVNFTLRGEGLEIAIGEKPEDKFLGNQTMLELDNNTKVYRVDVGDVVFIKENLIHRAPQKFPEGRLAIALY